MQLVIQHAIYIYIHFYLTSIYTYICVCVYIYVNTVVLLPMGLSSKPNVILERCYPGRMLSAVIPGGKGACMGFLHLDKSHIGMSWEFPPKPSQTLLFIPRVSLSSVHTPDPQG